MSIIKQPSNKALGYKIAEREAVDEVVDSVMQHLIRTGSPIIKLPYPREYVREKVAKIAEKGDNKRRARQSKLLLKPRSIDDLTFNFIQKRVKLKEGITLKDIAEKIGG
ncbi:hypothetical protein [Candidatus Oleimmundimicrobium sp.]|uniref:hypothetical protein n=1 Tax=Candidatus Oleimmundimicrobium sp. TaxID=3060597 RepID=UPI0027200093|nr:hypothetical protein [Candidatus Oleimmundimicrobium sp.]MDO8885723.1 hypothetical protein [Candidatus Oleimmundimicrobium sp.]